MKNILILLQLNAKQNFQKLRKPINHQEWMDFSPTTVNAYYDNLLNQIG
jgi:predicted metalloendopeptidase